MNTSQIKTFAINSRQILKEGVINKISSLGFNSAGEPVFGLPQKIQGATVYAGKFFDESFYDAWMSLYQRIKAKGIKDVYEEAAYTWFNRLVAIRIMQKNNLIEPVLVYSSEETRIPRIVAQARSGHLMTEVKASDKAKLEELLNDDSKTNEQFALLIENFCKYNPVIYNCFGGIEKYISILLPDNILVQGGFIDLLNHTSYITDEDYTKSELIGWLYQFYIAEKKDEVFESFKKGKKAEAEDIPAATQIFTPNWIVKYMVQNTIGRIYLDNNPYSSLGSEMKYLVGEKTPDEAILCLNDLQEYKMIDPACGSGHILVEAFDLFYSMYREEGYSSRQAIESILQKNIIGIDLDTRAKQLATFALLMKAAKSDESFLDCKVMPRVLDMPRPYTEWTQNLSDAIDQFYIGCNDKVKKETLDAFELLTQAENLGSIMKFVLSDDTRNLMRLRINEWKEHDTYKSNITEVLGSFELILALSDKYMAVVANPPYMGSGNMNIDLNRYVANNYPEGKADLFAVFMSLGVGLLSVNGKMGTINMQSWMFLLAFEKIRHTFLNEYNFDSFLHLGPRTFDELSGDVVQNASFVVSNHSPLQNCLYYRLVSGKNSRAKESQFLQGDCIISKKGQSEFNKIPGSPIAYWVSEGFIESYKSLKIDSYSVVITGMTIGDNNKYLRYWPEVDIKRCALSKLKMEDINLSNTYWIPYSKGGTRRQWYGNQDYLVNWSKKDNFNRAKTTLSHLYLKEAVTWPFIPGGRFSSKYLPAGSLWDVAGSPCFFEDRKMLLYTLSFLSSKVSDYFLSVVNPTINVQAADIKNLPLKKVDDITPFIEKAKENITISKFDWDAHETSWDFKTNELIALKDEIFLSIDSKKQNIPSTLIEVLDDYKSKWSRLFHQIHSNEEELNRQFIEIYGLQDELSPDVPLDEITILQQSEISIENNEIVWHYDVVIKQLISYAIGCWLGRYRLDKPGLHIAHPAPTAEEVCTYQYNGQDFEIDDDGIIPMMTCDSLFDDNGYNRIVSFIKTVFGEENLTENLNFIEKALGKSLEDYMIKDFWKDHKKMYQNRPIYWLFSSKKGAFQCLAYMHRMNPYTAERIRTKYLLRHIEDLKGRISLATERGALLTTAERKNLVKMQKDLDECLEYHDVLHEVADQQINFDLDDGVVVNYAKFGDVLAKIK